MQSFFYENYNTHTHNCIFVTEEHEKLNERHKSVSAMNSFEQCVL